MLNDELVLTPSDGSPAIRGKPAADAITRNPRLAAVLAHAGRDEDIQKGEVQAASQLEIENALTLKVTWGTDKKTVAVTTGELITSEYGVGLLANTLVHSGIGAAQHVVQSATLRHLVQHPYVAGDEAWRAGAEAVIIAALAAKDSDRAASLSKQLSSEPGSFR